MGKKNKYKKEEEEPEDESEQIQVPEDPFKIEPFAKGDMKHPLLEETSFATVFPRYREKYLQENWKKVVGALKEHGVKCELDLIEGSMSVRTTNKTWDPYSIIKARDMIRLLSRGMDVEQAAKIMQDEVFCDIIKIAGFVKNKERFIKRRQRLVGANGTTLKAIELLSNCYVLVHGTTVCAMGPVQGLTQVRKIVEDCMKNVHPVYNIKELMIKKEIAKNPELAKEDWSRFLPKYTNVSKFKRKTVKREKKEYTPFPPPQTPRKIDLQIESGEYFLAKRDVEKQRKKSKIEASGETAKERRKEKAKIYEPPVEPVYKREGGNYKAGNGPNSNSAHDTVQNIKKNMIQENENIIKKRSHEVHESNASDFFVEKKKRKIQ